MLPTMNNKYLLESWKKIAFTKLSWQNIISLQANNLLWYKNKGIVLYLPNWRKAIKFDDVYLTKCSYDCSFIKKKVCLTSVHSVKMQYFLSLVHHSHLVIQYIFYTRIYGYHLMIVNFSFHFLFQTLRVFPKNRNYLQDVFSLQLA